MATPMPPHSWHAKSPGTYDRTSTEAFENACCIYNTLHSLSWTLNAISGVLGNIGAESGYNPWSWFNDLNVQIPASTDDSMIRSRAYGLVQFYPGSKYIYDSNAQGYADYGPHFSNVVGKPEDGNAQIIFVNYHGDYIQTTDYPVSYANYKISTDTPENCAEIWLFNYERPNSPSSTEINKRRDNARYWYDLLEPYDPDTPPTPPTPIPRRKMPVWMMALKRLH